MWEKHVSGGADQPRGGLGVSVDHTGVSVNHRGVSVDHREDKSLPLHPPDVNWAAVIGKSFPLPKFLHPPENNYPSFLLTKALRTMHELVIGFTGSAVLLVLNFFQSFGTL